MASEKLLKILELNHNTVFHGSDMLVEKPMLLGSTRALDFGNGFYTTTNKVQAIRFAEKVQERKHAAEKHVNIYSIDLALLFDLKIRVFEKPNGEWLDFVSSCRNGILPQEQFDIVCGAVANDTIFKTFIAYQNGILNKRQTLARLKIRKLYNQIVFTSENALRCLKFQGELQ